MKCKKVRSLLAAMVSGELDSKAYAEAESHIDSCPDCRKEMLSYQASLNALTHAWSPVQAPESLVAPDCAVLNAGRSAVKPWFVSVGVALAAVLVAVLLLLPRADRMRQMQAMSPREDSRSEQVQPPKPPPVKVKPEPKPVPRRAEPQLEAPKWDEKRLRAPRRWDHVAAAPRSRKLNATPARPRRDEPATATVACTPPPRDVVTERTCTVPVTTKVTKQIITYDRFGNRQVTQVEAEEQTPQPCTMALY